MSKTFIISIDGDDNAAKFLQAVQDSKEVGYRHIGKTDKIPKLRIAPVLFIYPTDEQEDANATKDD